MLDEVAKRCALIGIEPARIVSGPTIDDDRVFVAVPRRTVALEILDRAVNGRCDMVELQGK